MASKPGPRKLEIDCKLWIFDNKPLCDLEWDPLEVCWQKPGTTKLEKFFEYSTKLGRQIIGSKSMGATQTRNSWRDKGISDDLLKSFWRGLWAFDMPEKIKLWLWLLSHKAIHVGERLRCCGGEAGCKICGHSLESIPHCFWNCAEAIRIWSRYLRIVATCGVNGSVVWGSLQGLKYRGRLGGTVKPPWSWIYSAGGQCVSMC